ncbi:MAG: hypothetical protein AAF529_20195 [Pseudomonadota bacterium]
MPSHTVLTNALTARARGAIQVKDRNNNTLQFAGDQTTLYRLNSTTWADVSRTTGGAYASGTEERWRFVQFKNQLVATNFSDNLQQITLGQANFAELTNALRARHIAVVGDFLVAANTFDAVDSAVPDRIRTSAFNNITDWIPSITTGSIARDLSGGPILGLLGGDFGLIAGQNDMWRMDFVGAPTWFRIEPTLPGIGLIGEDAWAQIGEDVYAWTNQGFVRIRNGTSYESIGDGRVDVTARRDLDDTNLHRIYAAADPDGGRIFWAYPGTGNTGGLPNCIIVYDKNFNKWAHVEQETEMIWSASGVGFTLEQLNSITTNLEQLPVSLDSSQWKGGGDRILAAFDSQHRHGFFNGESMTAVIETAERQLIPGAEALLGKARPLVDGGSFTVQMGTRNTQSESVTWGNSLSPLAEGHITPRSKARYHRFRLRLTGNWQDVIGVQVDRGNALPASRRG